jgi:hypothetical protein
MVTFKLTFPRTSESLAVQSARLLQTQWIDPQSLAPNHLDNPVTTTSQTPGPDPMPVVEIQLQELPSFRENYLTVLAREQAVKGLLNGVAQLRSLQVSVGIDVVVTPP